ALRQCSCLIFMRRPPPPSTLFPYTTLFRSPTDLVTGQMCFPRLDTLLDRLTICSSPIPTKVNYFRNHRFAFLFIYLCSNLDKMRSINERRKEKNCIPKHIPKLFRSK